MIPHLSEAHDQIFFDSTLYEIGAPPFTAGKDPKASARIWTLGFVAANDLKFVEFGEDGMVVQGRDIPQVVVLDGFLNESFQQVSKSLKWDILEYRGYSVVEIPKGHFEIYTQLQKLPIVPVRLAINVVGYSVDGLKTSGYSVNDFVQVNVNAFDAIHTGTEIDYGAAGISVEGGKKDLESVLRKRIAITSTGLCGRTISNEITRKIPYETVKRDRLGEVLSQDLEFIEAGLRFNVTPYPAALGSVLFQFDLELSSVEDQNQMPIVSSRKSVSEVILRNNEVVEVARIVVNEDLEQIKRGWFRSKFYAGGKKVDRVAIFAKRVQATK